MRYRLQGSVTIPRKPTTLGGIISWAKGVNRTLAELRDRKIVGMEVVRHGGGGSVKFPFQIYDTGTAFVSRAGTFNGSHGELTQSATTDGTWRLYASLTINATTGDVTASGVAWYASAQTDSSTTFYHLIGTGVVSGSGTTRTVSNNNYGPLSYLIRGGVTGDWAVNIY